MTEAPLLINATSSIVVMATIEDDEPVAIIQHILTTPMRTRSRANAEIVKTEMRLELGDVLALQVGLAKFVQQVVGHG